MVIVPNGYHIEYNEGRREGAPPKIGRFRIFRKLDAQLDVYSEIKNMCIYLTRMKKLQHSSTLFNVTRAIVC